MGITRIDQETMHSPLLKLREKYPTPGPLRIKSGTTSTKCLRYGRKTLGELVTRIPENVEEEEC